MECTVGFPAAASHSPVTISESLPPFLKPETEVQRGENLLGSHTRAQAISLTNCLSCLLPKTPRVKIPHLPAPVLMLSCPPDDSHASGKAAHPGQLSGSSGRCMGSGGDQVQEDRETRLLLLSCPSTVPSWSLCPALGWAGCLIPFCSGSGWKVWEGRKPHPGNCSDPDTERQH